jgi:hypothetical protein
LEPRNIPAAKTLALMMKKFPATFDPVMIVLPRPDSHQLAALDGVLKRLKEEKLIETSSSPSALVLDPARMQANREAAIHRDLTAAHAAMAQALTAAGLNASAFSETFGSIDGLRQQTLSANTWSKFLSPASPWWFLFDRMISPESGAAIAYARTPPQISGAERERITELVTAAVPGALVTGDSAGFVNVPTCRSDCLGT